MVYGDIMKVETSGASDHTARAYGEELRAGVPASQKMAKDDLGNMEKYKTIIENVAKSYDVDPALIAGIISRESEAGHSIKETNPPGWGDDYKAFGLMQVDKRYHRIPKNQGWDSKEHLEQATRILVDFIKYVQKERPSWTPSWQLKGAIAAYNMGNKVLDHDDLDQITTGGDYSSDVVARAQWFKENLFKSCIVESIVSFFWPW